MARELTKARALNVVGLERGADRNPKEEFGLTTLRDELRYVTRAGADAGQFDRTPITFPQRAPRERRCRSAASGAFLPGEGVGPGHRHPLGARWHWRFLPTDFRH